jgi:hypothetical protein
MPPAEIRWRAGHRAGRPHLPLAFAAAILALLVASRNSPAQTYLLQSMSGLTPVHAKAELASWRGRPAVRLLDEPAPSPNQATAGEAMALLADSDFEDGTIEADLASFPRGGAADSARGFAGIAFRIQPDGAHFECLYLRPTNARAGDQLRRNYSVQYVANPDFPWERLRQQNPGVYESYTDLEPGAWTHVKIVVSGTHAQLYVNGAAQPCLIVNDLKLGKTRGKSLCGSGPTLMPTFPR